MRLLVSIIFSSALVFAGPAFSSELDNEDRVTNVHQRNIKELPQTLVIRTDESGKLVEVLHSDEEISASEESVKALAGFDFKNISAEKIYSQIEFNGLDELNQELGRESWFFWVGLGIGLWTGYNYCCNYNYYYPRYSYYGYNYYYRPYYNYSWGGYNYWYYRYW